jgi:hypothetical protein
MYLEDLLQITTEREYTDEGFLKVPARISRTGTQTYTALEMGITDKEPDSKIVVFRPEEEVFDNNSLSSFANKPVTDNHPPELVNSKNAKQYSVGFAGPEVTKDGDFAKTILHVTDAEAIAKIESGKVELSNGYTADIDWIPGVTQDGEKYDAVQRNIKGNHIAIVERGRAGADCRLADNLPTEGDDAVMAKITIDGVDFEVTDQAAQAVGKLQTRLVDAEMEAQSEAEKKKAKEDELEEAKKQAKAKEDADKAELDAAKEKIPTADTIDKLVEERTALVDTVLKVMPEIEWQGKDAEALRSEVVAAKCSDVQMDSAETSPEYIKARFDILVADVSTNSQHNLDKAFEKQVTKDDDKTVDNRPESEIAREKMMKDSQDAWKKGTK